MKKFFIVTLSILLFLFGLSFGSNIDSIVSADETIYSSVLDDLSQDSSFNFANYLNDDSKSSLELVQIAESVNNELFAYVYNPSANKIATSINISTAGFYDKDFKNYKLKLLDKQNTLSKYLVLDLAIPDSHCYEITSIYRAWETGDPEPTGAGQTVSETPFVVGKYYDLSSDSCVVKDIDYINVTNKYVGFCRYDGERRWLFANKFNQCDSHFLAFSTDREITDLLEADVLFTKQWSSYHDRSGDTEYGEEIQDYANIKKGDLFQYESGLWSYERSRVQKTSDFIQWEIKNNTYNSPLITINQQNALTDSALADLKNTQWVLRFFESECVKSLVVATAGFNEEKTSVKDVSLLRLKFNSWGRVYNLGVIDNKQTGSDIPSNKQTYTYEWSKLAKLLFFLLILLLLMPIIAPFLPIIFKFVWKIIKFVAKCVWWVLKRLCLFIKSIFTLPFEAFGGE